MVRLAVVTLVCFFAASAAAQQAVPVQEAAPVPEADTRSAEARSLFERGVEMVRQERWPEAEAAFRASSEIVPRASVLYNLALALLKLGRAGESLAVLADLMATSDPVADARHRENATALRERAVADLAVIELRLEPPEARVRVDGILYDGDGSRRSLQLGTGRHVLEVEADGHDPARVEIEVHAGDRVEHTVALAARPTAIPPAAPVEVVPTAVAAPSLPPAAPIAPPPEVRGWPTLAWVLVGTGATLLAGALVTGVLAEGADEQFVDACGGTTDCDPSLKSKQTEARRLALATDILLAAGSAAAVSGVAVGLLTDDDGERPAGALVRVSRVF